MGSRWVFAVARAAVLATAALLLCRDIGVPFNGWHGLNDALYAEAGRNLARHGPLATRLYATHAGLPPGTLLRYLNHPPLLASLAAVPIALFGDHEWAARLVPILATLGTTALLVTIVCRLGHPLLGLLAGFFFATLPLTAYFGRMVSHEAPVQFFSLLTFHGYLQWTGLYGAASSRRRGAVAWAAGTVLGIATGWAALLAAGLLWCAHAWRVFRARSGEPRTLAWLTVVPALVLFAVLLHLLAGGGWDLRLLPALVHDRSLAGEGGQQPWPQWLALQWSYLVRNFTWPGALAALAGGPLLLAGMLHRKARGRWLPLAGGPAALAALCGLQGLIWVVVLKNQSWFHDYWQFYLAPYVALTLAGIVAAVGRGLGRRAPRLAALAVTLLLIAPMPFAAASLDFYASHQLVDPEYLAALRALGGLVQPGAPVWTSRHLHDSSERFAGREYRWPHPVVAYYADRPVYFSRDLAEVRANAPRCAAYVLRRVDAPWSRAIEAALSASFPATRVGENHVIFLMAPPPPVRLDARH